MQLLGGKTGYNDIARYCLVVGTKIEGRPYYMAFLGNEGKLTRFGDVARVADWVVSHKPKTAIAVTRPRPPRPCASGADGRRDRRRPAPAAAPTAAAPPTAAATP